MQPNQPCKVLGRFIDWDVEQNEKGAAQFVWTFEITADGAFKGERSALYMQTESDKSKAFILGIVEVMTGRRFVAFADFVAQMDKVLRPDVASKPVMLEYQEHVGQQGDRRIRLQYVSRATYSFKNSFRANPSKRKEWLLAMASQESANPPTNGARPALSNDEPPPDYYDGDDAAPDA